LSEETGEVQVIAPANTLNGESNVSSWDGVVTNANLGTDEFRLALLLGSKESGRGRWGSSGQAAKVLLSKLDKSIVLDTSSTNKNGLLGQVVGLDVVGEVVALDALDVLLGAENGATEWLALVGGGVQVVKDNLLTT
jgi:hypothetical protein